MSPDLQQILSTDELDDLFAKVDSLPALGSEDSNAIRSLLQEWNDRQAVANLLMLPKLIPTSERFEYLIKALQDTNVSYYALAAVVGLQDLRREDFTEQQRKQIVDCLIALMAADNPILAQRASVSIRHYLSDRDIPKIGQFLASTDDVIKHNTLVLFI